MSKRTESQPATRMSSLPWLLHSIYSPFAYSRAIFFHHRPYKTYKHNYHGKQALFIHCFYLPPNHETKLNWQSADKQCSIQK